MKWKWKDKTTQIGNDPVCVTEGRVITHPRRFGFQGHDAARAAPLRPRALCSESPNRSSAASWPLQKIKLS